MDSRSALTVSIGVLGGLAVAFTADVVTVPIWVVFLAWGSFVFVGGGVSGWVRSVSSNIVGVIIATASLFAAHLLGGSLLATAVAGRGHDVTVTTISHPGLVAACACVVGATFGIAAEYLAGVMTSKAVRNTVVNSAEGSPA
jgi:hypothetical protein